MADLPPGFVLDRSPAGPVYGAPAKPDKPREAPAGYEWDETGNLRIIPGGPADPNANPDKPPSGFRFKPGGDGVEPIPGGPADPDVATGTEQENSNTAYYKRALRALNTYDEMGLGPRSFVGEGIAAIPGGETILKALPDVVGDSDERRISEQAKRDFASVILRSDSGANAPEPEVERLVATFFPSAGEDDPDVLANYAEARRAALEGLKAKAGKHGASLPAYQPPGQSDGANPSVVGRMGTDAETTYQAMLQDPNATPKAIVAFLRSQGSNADEAQVAAYLEARRKGNAQPAAVIYGPDPTPTDPSASPPAADRKKEAEIDAFLDKMNANPEGPSGLINLATHGLTSGLTDEASGVGGFIANMLLGEDPREGYAFQRDAERRNLERARNAFGGWGTAAELLGAFALPTNALTKLPTLGNAARTGAVAGGLGGFGYGEGALDSVAKAVLGAGAGAAVGAGANKLGNTIADVLAGRAINRSALAQKAAELDAAGRAEGVTVNRAMVDPRLENRVTGADASIVGGPRVQRAMNQVESQIAEGTKRLGAPGAPMNATAGGDTIKRAGERFIERSGKSAKAKYDRAEQLAGDAKVTPKESLQRVDEMINTLGETSSTNSAEIAFLNNIKEDLAKDLSVGALRRMRTSLRKRISKGELTFGEDEARVLSIMDAAADDIRNGLTAQGKTGAARAFDAADKAYRARMDYINGTVQRLVGKRNSTAPVEDAWRRFQNMAKEGGDARGLRRFYASLAPDERSDVAATFAEELGKNNKGDFSAAHFLSQSEKLSDDAIRTIFGAEGAQSMRNLRLLAKETNRVTGTMNSRKSGTAVGNDWQGWLMNALLGAGPGFIADGVATAGIGAASTMGVKATRDILSARALMSPKLTKWLQQASQAQSPRAIDAQLRQLGAIAKAEPALTADIDVIRDVITRAVNDNLNRPVGVGAAASDGEENEDKQRR